MALWESTGQLATATLMDYALPSFVTELSEVPSTSNPVAATIRLYPERMA